MFVGTSGALVEGGWALVDVEVRSIFERTVTCGKEVIEKLLLIGQRILQYLLMSFLLQLDALS